MGFDMFPASMSSVKASKHDRVLQIYRIVALVVSIGSMAYMMGDDGVVGFIEVLFNWKVVAGVIFYLLATLAYFVDKLDKPACLAYLVAWTLIWPLTIFDWVIVDQANSLSPIDIFTVEGIDLYCGYVFPVLLILIDYVLNRICFVREQYSVPVVIAIILVFVLSLPLESTLETLMGALLLPLRIIIIVTGLIFLEIGRVIKARSCSNSALDQHLL
ncbi:hypothetical protein SteCoe_31379 [Stentor coeruleus]|uniref:Uncharacterized protein n=1 Tax=Stentor coeruleus TaxID=5963 RepID=A0A1R2B1F2_9CILI|nr:hypothetical protein SteCoe_31379 [Stentor coeruleus]